MDKPRFVCVTNPDWRRYLLQHFGDIDVPAIFFDKDNGSVWASADEFNAWRSTHTSTGEQKK